MSKVVLKLLMIGIFSISMVACSSTGEKENAQKNIEKPKEITLSVTTSLQDTGFIEDTLKGFEEENNVDVEVVSKGTGEALELGKKKDADILFVQDKDKEKEFIRQGYGVDRIEIMYNYFVIVGPKDKEHSEKLKEMSAEESFKYIKENNLMFLSRGDKSGTHSKELDIWKKSGVENEFKNYNEAHKGMGATLQMASEMRAYTLTDIGTYLATKDDLDLDIVKQADETLKNVYSIVTISDLDKEKKEITNKLVKYYKSEKIQNEIKEYGVDKYKEALFYVFE